MIFKHLNLVFKQMASVETSQHVHSDVLIISY